MRLNGRAAIMSYLGITGSWTWTCYKRRGMPIRYTLGGKVFAKSEDLDAWSRPKRPPRKRSIYGHDERGHFVNREQAGLQDAPE